MNTDNFLIEERDLELAQAICKPISNAETKNRALANAMAANIASKYFEEAEVDSESGLHNIAVVLEDIDIADIYIKNCYIDVRVFFNEEELAVPKSHFDRKLLPTAYMFIKITPDLSGATVIGFILPENIDTSKECDGYYKVSYDAMVSYYDIESSLITQEDTFAVDDKDIFAYLDNTIEDKNKFYAELIASKDGRLRLAKAAKAQYIFNFVSVAQPQDNAQENTTEDFTIEQGEPLVLDESSEDIDLLDNSIDAQDLESDDSIISEDVSLLDETENLNLNIEVSDAGESLEPVAEEDNNTAHLDFDPDSISFVQDDTEPKPEAVQDEVVEITDDLDLILDEDNTLDAAPEEEDISQPADDGELSNLLEESSEEDINESSSFKEEYKTVTSPSIDVYEELVNEEEENSALTEEDNGEQEEVVVEDEKGDAGENLEEAERDTSEEIDSLFNSESGDDINSEEAAVLPKKSNNAVKLLFIIALLAVLGALGYLGVSKFLPSSDDAQNNLVQEPAVKPANEPQAPKEPEAMPIETVEAPVVDNNANNEGNAVSIPAIEQNLDASILVSNLKVDWEVPAGYASNSSARRYLVKLGKIVQLNLKTELLLLSKPPISNKIAVEIKFNPSSKKFETVGITTSSGEQTVDDVILKTVQKALSMKLSMNSDSFAKLQGNPTLIIRL